MYSQRPKAKSYSNYSEDRILRILSSFILQSFPPFAFISVKERRENRNMSRLALNDPLTSPEQNQNNDTEIQSHMLWTGSLIPTQWLVNIIRLVRLNIILRWWPVDLKVPKVSRFCISHQKSHQIWVTEKEKSDNTLGHVQLLFLIADYKRIS